MPLNKDAWSIDVQEFAKIKNSVLVVDVREPEEWEESRIEGAIHIPLGDLPVRGPTELDSTKDIVLYCAHGIRSIEALMILRSAGFGKVRSLEGGISAWEENLSTNSF